LSNVLLVSREDRILRLAINRVDKLLMHGALDGGGTLSLRTDAQGKTNGAALLRMDIEIAEGEL
jgi:hypothetical protein